MQKYAPLLNATKGEVRASLEAAIANYRPVTLRDYQVEAREAVITEWLEGRRTMVAAATGSGKTTTLLSCVEWALQNGAKRALIIAHREELIFQPVERMLSAFDLPCPGIVMGEYGMTAAPIVVATIQTLSRGSRLNEILSHGEIGVVVVDELHRGAARTIKRSSPASMNTIPPACF